MVISEICFNLSITLSKPQTYGAVSSAKLHILMDGPNTNPSEDHLAAV